MEKTYRLSTDKILIAASAMVKKKCAPVAQRHCQIPGGVVAI